MVTTTPENFFHKLTQRDRWNLKDMTKKDEWLLRTSAGRASSAHRVVASVRSERKLAEPSC